MYNTKFKKYEKLWLRGHRKRVLTQQEWQDIKFLFERLLDPYSNDDIDHSFKSDPLYSLFTSTSSSDKKCMNIKTALLDGSVTPNYHFPNGQTPIHLCCQSGNFKYLEILVKSGKCDPNIADSACTRYSALIVSVIYGSVRCLQILLSLNTIDVNFKCQESSRTALQYAALFGSDDETSKLKCLRELLKHKSIDINCQDRCGYSPLHLAVMEDNTIATNLLIKV